MWEIIENNRKGGNVMKNFRVFINAALPGLLVLAVGFSLAQAAGTDPAKAFQELKKCLSNMRTLEGAMELYNMENGVQKEYSCRMLNDKGYVKAIPRCPLDPKKEYELEPPAEGSGANKVSCPCHNMTADQMAEKVNELQKDPAVAEFLKRKSEKAAADAKAAEEKRKADEEAAAKLVAEVAAKSPKLAEFLTIKKCVSNMKTLEGAVELYNMENSAAQDHSVKMLVEKGYLKKAPQCPLDVKAQYSIGAPEKQGGGNTIWCSAHKFALGESDARVEELKKDEKVAEYLKNNKAE